MVAMAIVAWRLVMTVRIPVTMPPTTTRWPVERLVAQVARVGVHEPADLLGDLAHRVLRQVQPEQLLLPAQPLADRHLGGAGSGRSKTAASAAPRSNSDVWPVIRSRWVACADGDRVVEAEQELGRVPERVERADLDERLEHLAVGQPQVDPRAEVGQRPELAALVAGRDDRLDGALADVLDRQQPEPDGVALDRELELAAVDVRRQDLDAHPAALGDGGRDLLLVRPEGGQDARSCSRPCGSPSGTRSGRRSARSTWRAPC